MTSIHSPLVSFIHAWVRPDVIDEACLRWLMLSATFRVRCVYSGLKERFASWDSCLAARGPDGGVARVMNAGNSTRVTQHLACSTPDVHHNAPKASSSTLKLEQHPSRCWSSPVLPVLTMHPWQIALLSSGYHEAPFASYLFVFYCVLFVFHSMIEDPRIWLEFSNRSRS